MPRGDAALMATLEEAERREIQLALGNRGVSLLHADASLRDDGALGMRYMDELGGHVFYVLSERLRASPVMAGAALRAGMGAAPLLPALLGDAAADRELALEVALTRPFEEGLIVKDVVPNMIGDLDGVQPTAELVFVDSGSPRATNQTFVEPKGARAPSQKTLLRTRRRGWNGCLALWVARGH